MTPVRGQARPPGRIPFGRDPRIAGDPTLSARLRPHLTVLALLVQGLLLAGVPAALPQARADEVPAPRAATPRMVSTVVDSSVAASRDSLLREIEVNSRMIRQLRDSLAAKDGRQVLSKAQRERFESSIDDISQVIENISVELSRLELEVQDNTISLLDERGDGIIIRIPDNLDKTLSEGFQAITEMVIEGLPDTLNAGGVPRDWNWSRFGIPEPEKPGRVIEGNIFRAGDDLLVSSGEDVRGSAVVVMGDAQVEGRVDGHFVVILGNLRLDDEAEVTGTVVTVGGRLDRSPGAKVGGEVVLDFLGGPRGVQSVLTDRGGGTFVVCQGLFLLMLTVALLAAIGAPEERFRRVTGALTRNPLHAAGVGALVALVVHLGAVVLAAVLVLTVVGLPLALLLAVALVLAGIVATAVAAAAVGERICRRRGGCPSRALAVTVGMIVLHLPSFVGSLFGMVDALDGLGTVFSLLGALVKLVAYLLGIGALTSTRLGTTRPAVAAAETVTGNT